MLTDGNHQLRRECAVTDFGSGVRVVRGIDLTRDETAEDPRFALSRLGRWLGDGLQASRLAQMCLHTEVAWSLGGVTREELRYKLEVAFRRRILVAIRPAGRSLSAQPSEPRGLASDVGREGPLIRGGWRMSGAFKTATVARKSDVPPALPVEQPGVPVRQLDGWLAEGPGRAALVEMYKSVYGPNDLAWAMPDILKAKLASAFESGKLVMLRHIDTGEGGGPEDTAGKGGEGRDKKDESQRRSQPPPPEKPVKTWIAFELVDEDGRPVPGELYRIRITDGSVREGRLGADGEVRIPNIDPGACTISFPEIDASEWHPL